MSGTETSSRAQTSPSWRWWNDTSRTKRWAAEGASASRMLQKQYMMDAPSPSARRSMRALYTCDTAPASTLCSSASCRHARVVRVLTVVRAPPHAALWLTPCSSRGGEQLTAQAGAAGGWGGVGGGWGWVVHV